jgi:pimeloyl-ACP methyl ester carboxylesterase
LSFCKQVLSVQKGANMAAPYSTVVLPGIGGSSLSVSGGVGGKTRVWYNPVKILQYSPVALALAADGVSPFAPGGKSLFPDGPVDLGIYEPLLTQLQNDGLNPVFSAYDWRLNLNSLASGFVNFLQSTQLTNPFHVVCHSMGGLIAQLAYPLWLATNPTKVWKTTVYLGTPHGGSYWAGACLAGQWTTGAELYGLANLLNVSPIVNPAAFSTKLALLVALGAIAGSWPALYCLLPNYLGPWAPLDLNASFLSQPATYNVLPGGQQAQWFTLARAVMAQLVAGYSTPRPTEIHFVGAGESTLNSFRTNNNPQLLTNYGSTGDGDGTVAVARAVLSVGEVVNVNPITHNSLCQNFQVTQRIAPYLQTSEPSFAQVDNTPIKGAIVPPLPSISFLPVPTSQGFVNRTLDP